MITEFGVHVGYSLIEARLLLIQNFMLASSTTCIRAQQQDGFRTWDISHTDI